MKAPICVIAGIVTCAMSSAGCGGTSSETEKLTKEIQHLRKEVAALKEEIAKAEKRVDETIRVGETLVLRSPSGRPITGLYVTRPRLLQSGTGQLVDPAMVHLVGREPGETTVTITDDKGETTRLRVRIEALNEASSNQQ